MKKWVLSLALCFSCFNIYAFKLATVDMDTVLKTSPKAASLKADLEKQFGERNKQIAAQAKALQDEFQNYDKNKAILSADKLDKMKKDIQVKGAALQQSKQQFQQDLSARQMQISNQMIDGIKNKIASIAKKDGFDLVLPSAIVLYSGDVSDITPQVVKSLK
tara:strand:+ start:769 stop:1254 length:486 start_codon:yes stop_codon:yes gene_type:complete